LKNPGIYDTFQVRYSLKVDKNDRQKDKDTHIAWHPAFYQAIQAELLQYKDILHYEFEYQLTAEPLRMDILIIKKEKDVVIEKNIAAIFKKSNIVEYKSPDDYVSIDDFYKVYGYACLYAALKSVPVTDLTITFMESRYPQDLIKHLAEIRSYRVEEKWPGIYIVSGDIIPIQIIDSKRLSADDNIWLRDLNNKIDGTDINRLSLEIKRQGLAPQMGAYLYAVYLANWPKLEEAIKMSDAVYNFERILNEAGLIAKWEAEGEAKGEAKGEARGEVKGIEKVLELIKQGYTSEEEIRKRLGM
jgi:hypothetical protein